MRNDISSVLFERSSKQLPRVRRRPRLLVAPIAKPAERHARLTFLVGQEPRNCRILNYVSVTGQGGRFGTAVADVVLIAPEPALPFNDEACDGLRTRQSMRSGGSVYNGKEISPKKAVLMRFLGSRVGQQWTDVLAEVRRSANLRSFAGSILQNVLEVMVCTSVEERDGKLLNMANGKELSRTLTSYKHFFVHPRTGELQRMPRISKADLRREKETQLERPEQVVVNGNQRLVCLNSIWYMVNFLPLPRIESLPGYRRYANILSGKETSELGAYAFKPEGPKDVILGEEAVNNPADSYVSWPNKRVNFRVDRFVDAWGGQVYAASKRQANSRELRRARVRGH